MSQAGSEKPPAVERFPFTQPVIEKSIIQRFEELMLAIENLRNLNEAIKEGGPFEDNLRFQGHAELYRTSLSSLWHTLQNSIWPSTDGNECVEHNQKTDGSLESATPNQEDRSLMLARTGASSNSWATCPTIVVEQIGYIYQTNQQLRLQVQDLHERIAFFEERLRAEESTEPEHFEESEG